ncbi:phospholipase D-like domain-containing protein [Jannaschia formosa]|uniref:phospholipase D-like domain-containing protein n=1 Tax=Jannaschia formosa TaxID=2259592 RepID=UPI00142F95D7|nr:phospholipase D-like domain-containing protein [Jannaschia formosa]
MDDQGPQIATTFGQGLFDDKTFWRVERADRLRVIIDAARYFVHLRDALRQAKHSIYLIGWDFDLRLEMQPGESDEDGNAPDGLPNRLGEFLKHLVEAEPGLSLYILKWDKAMVTEIPQQATETLSLTFASDRIHFALDSHHPVAATHHQKIVVIDDQLAFCGGIDVTGGRWDTRDHLPEDPRRVLPDGTPHKPWHDVTTAMSGRIAVALGDLARGRWKAATGDELDPPQGAPLPWPDDLASDLEGIDVAIARTAPDYHDQDAITEIESFYLAAIESAQKTIYLESQYFASGSICRALEARLAEPDGPEIVVINPLEADGFFEHELMDTARARMIERVSDAADRGNGRFRILYPVNAAETPIYVHAKVLIVDDRLVRVGSSNINNRSMDFDTECDVAFACTTSEQRDYALCLRHSLLAEHLDCEVETVARAIREEGSLIGAIERLSPRDGRRLVPLQPEGPSEAKRHIGEKLLFDDDAQPHKHPDPARKVAHRAMRTVSPYHVEAASIGSAVVTALAVGAVVWGGLHLYRRYRRQPLAAPPVLRHVDPLRGSDRLE